MRAGALLRADVHEVGPSDGQDARCDSPKTLMRPMAGMFMLSELMMSLPVLCESPGEPGNTL